MKTTIIYIFSLTMLLAIGACSKKSSSNDDSNTKFPDNIAATWGRTITTMPTGIEDTFTTKGADERWMDDKVILSSSEASKLQSLIQAVPRQIRDDFAGKVKKYKDEPASPVSVRSDIRPSSPAYEELQNFCLANKHTFLPLAMGYLFNDADETIRGLGNTTMAMIVLNEFADLKQEVLNDIQGQKYTANGIYKVNYTDIARQRRLAKKILNQ